MKWEIVVVVVVVIIIIIIIIIIILILIILITIIITAATVYEGQPTSGLSSTCQQIEVNDNRLHLYQKYGFIITQE